MIVIKTEKEIARMRVAGGMAAEVRRALMEMVAPGVTTRDLEAMALKMIDRFGAQSAFKGYQGFPGAICVSINDEVVHGIPGERIIQQGDLVSIDVGVEFDGFIGDCAATAIAGKPRDSEHMRLLEVTRGALEAGTARATDGSRLGDVSHVIESSVVEAGFSIVREFVGHGIGSKMHEEPQIPNFGPAGKGPKLKYGMTLAIEPMVNLGGAAVEVMTDNWTVRTLDRLPSAHFENTILVGMDGPEILTNPDYAGK